MRTDYRISGPTAKLELQVEAPVAATLQAMAEFTKIPISELANTALQRFIASHKDFLPPPQKKKSA